MRFYTIVLFLFTIIMAASGQDEMTLQKAISIGLENNFQIKIDDKFIMIAENNDTWARAGRTPIVDLTGTFNNSFTKDNNPASFLQGTFYNGTAGIGANASFVIYAGGRVRISKDQLELNTTRLNLEKESAINTLIRDIYQAYYEVIFQKERNTVLRNIYQLSKDRLEYENTKKQYGASNTFNLVQFENAMITDSLNLINQNQSIAVSEKTLYGLLRLEPNETYSFSERLNVAVEEIDKDALQENLYDENFTLRNLEMVASLNQLNTKLAEAARKPTFSANASGAFNENAFKFYGENPITGTEAPTLFSNRYSGAIGVSANWNIYDGNVRKIDVQNARIQEEIDQLTIEEAQIALSNQLDILIDNYDNQKEVLQMTNRQITLADQNIEIAEERFKSGQITSLDYRNIQNQYINAVFSRVNAIYNLIITKSEIDHLVGGY